jgi:hypothetical protein
MPDNRLEEQLLMFRALKDFIKLNVLTDMLAAKNFETSLGAAKIGVLAKCAVEALKLKSGDFLEFGVARGGTTCILSKLIVESAARTRLWGFDSFTGFDPQEWNQSVKDGSVSDDRLGDSFSYVREDYVRQKLKRLGLSGPVSLVKGYFEATLPDTLAQIPGVSLCFIDCDLPASVAYCAATTWPKLLPGGFMIFDDYRSPEYGVGVRNAVDTFVSADCMSATSAHEEAGLFVVQR